MVARQGSHSNGRVATPNDVPGNPPGDLIRTLTTQDILRAAAELSRKLQWAIGTSWYSTTGERASKKHIDSLSTRLAATIIDELHHMHQNRSK